MNRESTNKKSKSKKRKSKKIKSKRRRKSNRKSNRLKRKQRYNRILNRKYLKGGAPDIDGKGNVEVYSEEPTLQQLRKDMALASPPVSGRASTVAHIDADAAQPRELERAGRGGTISIHTYDLSELRKKILKKYVESYTWPIDGTKDFALWHTAQRLKSSLDLLISPHDQQFRITDNELTLNIIVKCHGSLMDFSKIPTFEYEGGNFTQIIRDAITLRCLLLDESKKKQQKSGESTDLSLISYNDRDFYKFAEKLKRIEVPGFTMQINDLLQMGNCILTIPEKFSITTFIFPGQGMDRNQSLLSHLMKILKLQDESKLQDFMRDLTIPFSSSLDREITPCAGNIPDSTRYRAITCNPIKHLELTPFPNMQLDFNDERPEVNYPDFTLKEEKDDDFGIYVQFINEKNNSDFHYFPCTRESENDPVSMNVLLNSIKMTFPDSQINCYLYNCLQSAENITGKVANQEDIQSLLLDLFKLKSDPSISEMFSDRWETLKAELKVKTPELFYEIEENKEGNNVVERARVFLKI